MGTGSTLYRIVLLAHVTVAIVGFGGLMANGIANARAFHAPAIQAVTLLRSSQAVAKVAEYSIYGVLALGIVLVAISDSAFSFGAIWVSAAFLVWGAIIGVTHGMVRPSVRGLVQRAESLSATIPGPILETDAEAAGLGRRLAIGEGLIQVLLLVALYLMVWQPGN